MLSLHLLLIIFVNVTYINHVMFKEFCSFRAIHILFCLIYTVTFQFYNCRLDILMFMHKILAEYFCWKSIQEDVMYGKCVNCV